jgi:thiol-disulfide isomerase/thioredoxin
MNKIASLLIVLLFISCSGNHPPSTRDKVIISGKVNNYDPDNIKVNIGVNRVGLGSEQLSANLDKNGFFKKSFKSNLPTDLWLRYNKTNFLVLTHPGDSIYIEFDGSKKVRSDLLKTIKFQGDASKLNHEAAKFQQLYYAKEYYSFQEKNRQAIKDFDEARYKLFRDSVRNVETVFLDRFIKEFKPSWETKKWARITLDVEYYRNLIEYPEFHRITNNLKREEWNVPISYYDFLKNLFSFNDSILISGYSISAFVNFYPIYLTEKMKNDNKLFFASRDSVLKYPEKMDSLRFFGAINYTHDSLLGQMVLTEMLNQGLEQSEIRLFKKYENLIDKYIQKPYLKEPLFSLYHETIERLDNPKLASDVILKKIDGTSIKSDIDKILSDNKGKVVYMDCWGTWCGPCIAEMPNSKRLIDNYKNKDVAFIFICLDSEDKEWKSIISKYSLGGQQYLFNKNQSSDFKKVFGIKGVPHYILFDKNGDINDNGTLSPSFISDKLDILLTAKHNVP